MREILKELNEALCEQTPEKDTAPAAAREAPDPSRGGEEEDTSQPAAASAPSVWPCDG